MSTGPDADRAPAAQDWPGQRLGLPQRGSGSVARVGRRAAALAVDWAACSLVSAAFLGHDSWATLLLFVAEQVLLVTTSGAGFGHVLLGLRVRPLATDADRLPPRAPWPLRALLRAVGVALVVPALVFDADQRGLHDRLAGTVLLRR